MFVWSRFPRLSVQPSPCQGRVPAGNARTHPWLQLVSALLAGVLWAGGSMAAPAADAAPAASSKRAKRPPPAAAPKAAAPSHAAAVAPAPAPLVSAANLDLERFMGLWYKVAKVEEPQDALRTRERYEFLQRYDGGVRVIATSYDPLSNRWDRRQDYMAPVDAKGAALSSHYQLPIPVHFSISRFGPFGVSYYVVALDPYYQWAMVAGPGPKSFSILSRRSELELEMRTSLEQLATRQNLLKAALQWAGPDQESAPR